MISRIKNDLRRSYDMIIDVPRLLLLPTAFFLILSTLGIISVIIESNNFKKNSIHHIYTTVALPTAYSIESLLKFPVGSLNGLISHMKSTDNCSSLIETFPKYSEYIAYTNKDISTIEFDVANVVSYNGNFMYPKINLGSNLSNLINCDLLSHNNTCFPVNRERELFAIQAKNFFIQGPIQGDHSYGLFVLYPIWKPAPNYYTDLGCGIHPTDCENYCWDNVNKIKYFGTAAMFINFDSLVDGTFIGYPSFHEDDDFEYSSHSFKLRVSDLEVDNYNFETSGNILYSRGKSNLIDPVIAQISLYNLKLQFEVAPDNGWYPSWRTPLIIGSVLISFLLSLGLLRYLLVSQRHIKLLNSMLPIQAVKHLEIEDKVFAEHYNLATILFADIVGYTVIASSLTPIQVVALLDELYTIFDILVKKHGVYKGSFAHDSIFNFKFHSKHIYSYTHKCFFFKLKQSAIVICVLQDAHMSKTLLLLQNVWFYSH